MTEKIIHLENEFIEVGVYPECGASLVYFRTKSENAFDVMRPASQTAISKKDVLGMSMFPMLPYAFRIKGGEFTYWGIKRLVPLNHPLFSDPIHGDGWKSSWKVRETTSSKVVLTLKHEKEKDKGYPFSYESKIVYSLTGKTLNIELNLTNKGLMPMPCGLGLHPYFNKTQNVELKFSTKNVWHHENDPIDRPYRTPEEWSFKESKPLNEMVFDTCFGGFENSAEITWPKYKHSLKVRTDDLFSHLALYAPYRKNFFCLEPTSMTADAFNIAARGVVGSGIQSIGKDETLTGVISFEVNEF
ncbi:MAG: hypothetical protein E7013_00010 [Alphaproteobacteria bacterium]|nr:hypothetical protein [Alphaproteobacteria bacterium]